MKLRKLLLLTAFSASALTATTSSQAADLDGLKSQGFARIAIANEPPWTQVTSDGKVSGAGPDVASAVLKKLGVDEIVASI